MLNTKCVWQKRSATILFPPSHDAEWYLSADWLGKRLLRIERKPALFLKVCFIAPHGASKSEDKRHLNNGNTLELCILGAPSMGVDYNIILRILALLILSTSWRTLLTNVSLIEITFDSAERKAIFGWWNGRKMSFWTMTDSKRKPPFFLYPTTIDTKKVVLSFFPKLFFPSPHWTSNCIAFRGNELHF